MSLDQQVRRAALVSPDQLGPLDRKVHKGLLELPERLALRVHKDRKGRRASLD